VSANTLFLAPSHLITKVAQDEACLLACQLVTKAICCSNTATNVCLVWC